MEEIEKAKDRAEKARDEVEQEKYDIGVVETKESLKDEVSNLAWMA